MNETSPVVIDWELPVGRWKGPVVTTKKGLPVLSFPTQEAWEKWLADEHSSSSGVWLKFAKKGSGIDSVTYSEAVETALCYGWIDGQSSGLDDRFYLQRFTPRRPKSKWSKINRTRATELIEKGAMRPAGLREVERAKADGRWDAAYDSPRTATVPEDFQRALDKDDRARAFFATLNSTNRYAMLYQLQDAKRPETRRRRIEKFIAMLNEHKKLYP